MVAIAEPIVHGIKALIASLREGEPITVYVRRLPEEMHFTGYFLSTTETLGREWLDLAIDGFGIMGIEIKDIWRIERQGSAVDCGQ